MGLIYKFTFPNGKVYIGQTKKRAWKRWHLHRVRANKCWYLARAIKKYGWDNIKKEVLVELPDALLDEYEVKFIALYGCVKPNGYNLTKGGDFNPMDSKTIRKRQLSKVRDPTHRKQQSERTAEWHKDDEKHEYWSEKNAESARSDFKRSKHKVSTTESWKNPEHRKNRTEGLKRAFSDPEVARKRAAAAHEGRERPEVKAKAHATMLRKREELLAKLPPEKREAKRADLERRAAAAARRKHALKNA